LSAFATSNARVPWVLVVDDDPLMARSLSRVLSATTGARVSIVANVDDALRLVLRGSEAPAVAILDFELAGGETGLGLLLSLRSSGSEVPCVFHTGVPSRALAALESSRLGDGYPVFEKGSGEAALLSWVTGIVAGGASRARSGTRRRVVTS
jgi:ActR/RegA family two-component response regulator